MSGYWIRGRMRGFPFGTFSSFNSLPFRSMTGPSAEREAPHATSPVAIEICSMQADRIWPIFRVEMGTVLLPSMGIAVSIPC